MLTKIQEQIARYKPRGSSKPPLCSKEQSEIDRHNIKLREKTPLYVAPFMFVNEG